MHAWDHPKDPDPIRPPDEDEDPNDPNRRPDPDPEAQQAPGAGQEDPTGPTAPPMQAGAADEHLLDAAGIAREPIGNDNIRNGTVGGVMGAAHATNGQGQGG
jgi:hypothetical protein